MTRGGTADDDARLREENALLRAIVEYSSDVIDVLEADGTLRAEYLSRDRVLGYEPGEIVGRNVFELVHEGDRELALAAFAQLTSEPGAKARVTLRFRHKQGHYVHIEVVGHNRLDDPAVHGLILYSQDVTERIALERRLRLSQRLEGVGRLASGIAHDFNNLLSLIMMSASVARRGGPDAAGHLQDVFHAAERGASMVKRLLAYAHDRPVRRKRLKLGTFVESLERSITTLLPEFISFRITARDHDAEVIADPAQMEQVLLNLVVNARDAMPTGGALRVEVAAEGSEVRLSVVDDGSGMDEATRQRAFEPFFTTKDMLHGTGLGLSSVHDIVSASGGSVRIESAPGRGTRVEVILPRADFSAGAPAP